MTELKAFFRKYIYLEISLNGTKNYLKLEFSAKYKKTLNKIQSH